MVADLFDHDKTMDADRTVEIYETLRHRNPANIPLPSGSEPEQHDHLTGILGRFDALLLDGYGVLNIGAEAVPGAVGLLEAAAREGVEVMVLTNGGSKPSAMTGARYRNLGLAISDDRVISSRDALIEGIAGADGPIGVIDAECALPDDGQPDDGQPNDGRPDDSQYVQLDPSRPDQWLAMARIVFFGATAWTLEWQECLIRAMEAGIPVHIANPDVAAPHEGVFSFEPGYWTAAILDRLPEAEVHWYGKPHRPIFDLAIRRLEAVTGRTGWDQTRIAMVGDTLHTDILGGNAAGLATVLITGHGLFRYGGAEAAMEKSGIQPNFITRAV